MASRPATKASYAGYTQAGTTTAKPVLRATRDEYVAKYYKDTPIGKGKTTRATNRKTALHHHLSNRLAAAAHKDAWHNKDRASGQR